MDGAIVGSKVFYLYYGLDLRQVCHICELQVHLKQFLACKKYTHLPYAPAAMLLNAHVFLRSSIAATSTSSKSPHVKYHGIAL